MKKYIEIKNGFTHGGKFHADDVFSAALLKKLNPDFVVERGFTVPENFEGIVFDIGLGKFDHHQQERKIRENGMPYAAFGLLWEEFGELLLPEKMVSRFDEKFIQPLDLNDNTGEPDRIADIISVFNPPWDYHISSDLAFDQAVKTASCILEKELEYLKSICRAEDVVLKAIEESTDQILYLKKPAPWKKFVKGTEILFVIFPSSRGGYCAQAVPDETEKGELKISFPENWRGLDKEMLAKISGIETLTFCHNSGFLISALTKKDAIKACMSARQNNNKR